MKKVGVSEDGDYIYYLSMNKDADKDLTASLKKSRNRNNQNGFL